MKSVAFPKEIAALEEQVRVMRKALLPFSECHTHVVPTNGDDYSGLCLACRARDDGTGKPSSRHKENCPVLILRKILDQIPSPILAEARQKIIEAAKALHVCETFAFPTCRDVLLKAVADLENLEVKQNEVK